MPYTDVGSTRPSLLGAVADWDDRRAWAEFRRRYDPLLSACCRGLGLDDEATEDVVQETWIQVANRMRTFRYDPSGSFRGWLWRVCRYGAIDRLRKRGVEPTSLLDGRDEPPARAGRAEGPGEGGDDDDVPPGRLGALRREAARIQGEVQRRVDAETWEAFRLVDLETWTVKDAARHLGKSEAGVYKSVARVRKRLAEEGGRSGLRPEPERRDRG